jgi:prolyl-tRNA synthetase
MRQSQLFTRTRREAPKDEVAKNAQLLIRAGFVHKELAGVYTLLPLGLRVVNKISNIIRDELDQLGACEVEMTALQNPELYEQTGRWDDKVVDNWFKTNLKSGAVLGLGFTHEEAITALMKNHISSYRDLPKAAYQIQTKFRNEERAKSGILRGREFLMKDLYSFHASENDRDHYYDLIAEAYKRIYNRIGIGDRTYLTFATGGVFSKYSHEFQTLCETGEDTIYVSEKNNLAVNKEVYTEEVLKDLGLTKDELVEKKAIETGNIFKLGTKFSEPLGLNFVDEQGVKQNVIMASYGIGIGRLMGTVVELLGDEKGLVWPEAIAPFKYHLLVLPSKNDEVRKMADNLYNELVERGVEVLYDDRDASAGEKFADADLLGLPLQIIIGERSVGEGKVEVKNRLTGEVKNLPLESLAV